MACAAAQIGSVGCELSAMSKINDAMLVGMYFRLRILGLTVFIALLSNQSWANYYRPDDPEQIALDKKNLEVAVIQYPQRSNARTTLEHLAEERSDQQSCRRLFALISKSAHHRNLREQGGLHVKDFQVLIEKTPYSNHPHVLDFLRRSERVFVYESFHRSASVSNIGVLNCSTDSWVRTLASEKLALNANSFALRTMLIQQLSSHIEFPVEGLADGFSFEQIQRFFAESYALYGKTKFNVEIDQYLRKVIAVHQREILRGAPTYTPEGQDELRRRIAEYQKMLSK
jgi:hypothetical protein